jgi:5-methylcytosine-specific restriction endonuclease McrA
MELLRAQILETGMLDAKQKYDAFYQSRQWRELRYQAFLKYGKRCHCCQAIELNVRLHVDHIKPRSKYPELELDIENLQILCESCNVGKGAWDETNWRNFKEKSGVKDD